LCYTNM